MKPLLLSIFLAASCFLQSTTVGNSKTVGNAAILIGAAPTTVVYSQAAGFGGATATESTTFGSNPATGSAIAGIVLIFNQSNTLSSVCDGGGVVGCTGSSSYTIEPVYHNGINYDTYLFFTCDYVGTGGGTVTFAQTAAGGMYGDVVVATGNTTAGTNCDDGIGPAQNTLTVTTYVSSTITTTNSHDLLVGLFCALNGSSFTAGTDGQGNSYTLRDSVAGAMMVETLSESSTNNYSASATGSSSTYNAYVLAIK